MAGNVRLKPSASTIRIDGRRSARGARPCWRIVSVTFHGLPVLTLSGVEESFVVTPPSATAGEGAGLQVESSKGEAWPGQHEINFRYADAVTAADNHVVYKNGAKELAHQNGCSITFMAKPDHASIGSSCHIHSSLWRDDENAFAGET